MTTNIPFQPSRLVLLSEMTTREKEAYYTLLSQSDAKFYVDSEGRYVSNLRLLAPGRKKLDNEQKRKDLASLNNNALIFEDRLRRFQEQGFISVRVVGVEPFDYHTYPRFVGLVSGRDEVVHPRPKLLSWLMRLIEEIYDARHQHETAEVDRDEGLLDDQKISSVFPAFVVRRLSMRNGLRSIVDQMCWDLLYNTHVYRRDYLEVEIFARFLQEFYDHDDLLFFLYVRSVVSKLLRISFKTRWSKNDGPGRQPRSLWMSYKECVSVAKTVFGASNESMSRDFLAIITPQLVGQRTESGDTRRIDITQFLHLAVVGYHTTRPVGPDGAPSGRGMRVMPGEVVPMVPATAPSGGAYMSKYSPFEDSARLFEPQGTANNSRGSGADRGQVEALEQQQYEEDEQQHEEEDEEEDGVLDADEDYYGAGTGGYGGLGGEAVLDEEGYQADPFMNVPSLDAYLNQLKADFNKGDAGASGTGGRGQGAPRSVSSRSQQQQQLQEPVRAAEEEGGAEPNLLDLAAAPVEVGGRQIHNGEDGNGQDPSAAAGEGEGEEEAVYDEMSEVLMHREKEFLGFLCEPLEALEDAAAEQCIELLADELRTKLAEILQNSAAEDAASFDDELVGVLSSEDFTATMEDLRSQIVDYVQQQQQQPEEGAQ